MGTNVERTITADGTMSARGCYCYVEISNLTIPCPPENSTAAQAAELAIVPMINEDFVNDALDDPEGILFNPHVYVDRRGGPVNGSDCTSVAFLSEEDTVEDPQYYVGKYLQITGGPGIGQVAEILTYNQFTKMVTIRSWRRNGYEVCVHSVARLRYFLLDRFALTSKILQRNATVNTQPPQPYIIGYANVRSGGSGYRDGV